MHILLTGAFGFIGINLLRSLASRPNVNVTAVDRYAPDAGSLTFLSSVLEATKFAVLDVTDRSATQALVADVQPTHIIHAAALTPTYEQEKANPTVVVDTNLNGVINVLDAARHVASVERLLMISSSGVYGASTDALDDRQLEVGPFALDKLYSITKYCAELLAARYGELGTQMITSLRLPPVYGPMERPSLSRPRVSQIDALRQALQAGQSVNVANPSVARDWTHVDDIARAVWSLLVAEKWNYPVYNASFGAKIPFRLVVESFEAHGLTATWVDNPTTADIYVPHESARLALDIQRLQTDTDFVPMVDIADGVARLLKP